MLISILTLVTENKNGKKTDESTLGKGEGKINWEEEKRRRKEREINYKKQICPWEQWTRMPFFSLNLEEGVSNARSRWVRFKPEFSIHHDAIILILLQITLWRVKEWGLTVYLSKTVRNLSKQQVLRKWNKQLVIQNFHSSSSKYNREIGQSWFTVPSVS